MSDAFRVISEYGFSGFISLLAIGIIGWVGRVALKNPLEIVSAALADVNLARQALREEVSHKQSTIEALTGRIDTLTTMVSQLEVELDEMRDRYERAESRLEQLKQDTTNA